MTQVRFSSSADGHKSLLEGLCPLWQRADVSHDTRNNENPSSWGPMLWKMRNWAESANMGTGVPAFQAVFEVLMDAARELVPAAQLRPDGLTAAMFEKALVKEGGAQLALPAAHLELTHMHVAADASVITKEKFLNALVTALDPGPQPRAAESPVKAGGAGGIEEDVPAGGEEIEESSVLK